MTSPSRDSSSALSSVTCREVADGATQTQGVTRRRWLGQGAALTSAPLFTALGHLPVWAAGSDAPEKTEVKIGFIPLTDCASVVMANVLGFDKKYGVTIVPTKEASWAGVRDKLVNGDLDMAHVLYGLVSGPGRLH